MEAQRAANAAADAASRASRVRVRQAQQAAGFLPSADTDPFYNAALTPEQQAQYYNLADRDMVSFRSGSPLPRALLRHFALLSACRTLLSRPCTIARVSGARSTSSLTPIAATRCLVRGVSPSTQRAPGLRARTASRTASRTVTYGMPAAFARVVRTDLPVAVPAMRMLSVTCTAAARTPRTAIWTARVRSTTRAIATAPALHSLLLS